MAKVAFYGAGGVGKSVVSANCSVALAREGLSVLHVGCGHKVDSWLRITGGTIPPPTVLRALDGGRPADISSVVRKGSRGIDCLECGAPPPGSGCAGRALSRCLDVVYRSGMLERYDFCVFDVSGDLTCAGFAAPFRPELAEFVVLVTSDSLWSLHSANRICQALARRRDGGVALAGLVLNISKEKAAEPLEAFARMINTRVLAVVQRTRAMRRAESRRTSVFKVSPTSAACAVFERLARRLIEIGMEEMLQVQPLDEGEFWKFSERMARWLA